MVGFGSLVALGVVFPAWSILARTVHSFQAVSRSVFCVNSFENGLMLLHPPLTKTVVAETSKIFSPITDMNDLLYKLGTQGILVIVGSYFIFIALIGSLGLRIWLKDKKLSGLERAISAVLGVFFIVLAWLFIPSNQDSEITIKSAVYGTQKSGVDVTEAVRNHCKEIHPCSFRVDPLTLGTQDPDPGQIKTLSIAWSCKFNGMPTVLNKDYESVNLSCKYK